MDTVDNGLLGQLPSKGMAARNTEMGFTKALGSTENVKVSDGWFMRTMTFTLDGSAMTSKSKVCTSMPRRATFTLENGTVTNEVDMASCGMEVFTRVHCLRQDSILTTRRARTTVRQCTKDNGSMDIEGAPVPFSTEMAAAMKDNGSKIVNEELEHFIVSILN